MNFDYENNPLWMDKERMNWFKRWAVEHSRAYYYMVNFAIICIPISFLGAFFTEYANVYPLLYNIFPKSFYEFIVSLSGGFNFFHVVIYFVIFFSISYKIYGRYKPYKFYSINNLSASRRPPGILLWAFLRGARNENNVVENDYSAYCKRIMEKTGPSIQHHAVKFAGSLFGLAFLLSLHVARVLFFTIYVIDSMTASDTYTSKTVIVDKWSHKSSRFFVVYIDGVQYSKSITSEAYEVIEAGDSVTVRYRKGFFGFPIVDNANSYIHSDALHQKIQSKKAFR